MIHVIAVSHYLQTHVFGVFLAIIASFLIGFLWHGPLFGKQWMKLNGMKQPEKGEVTFSMMLPGFGASILMPFVQACVIGRTLQIVSLSGVGQALIIAVILWLPFTALVLLNEYTWAGKSFAHTCFDAAYNLASMLAITAVLYVTL